MEALYGAMVHDRILANEPISNAKLLRSGDGGYMAVVLKPGMRAVAIPVSVNTAAGGFILPGDRVDVLQAHQSDTANGGKPGFAVETLLRNVRVLAIDQATQQVKGAESMVGVAATLEVEDADAAVLARAKAQGEVILALRPFGDPGSPESSGSAGEPGAVRIVRAGQVSDVMVAQ
jgi:pilus assembly protein CpaB